MTKIGRTFKITHNLQIKKKKKWQFCFFKHIWYLLFWDNTVSILLFILTLSSDWLIIYGFTSNSRIFHLYGHVTIAGEGLQNLGLCSELKAFEQGGIFIVPHLLWHGSCFSGLIQRTTPINRILRHRRGCGGSILTRILTGMLSSDDRFFFSAWRHIHTPDSQKFFYKRESELYVKKIFVMR
jgi:hypothetical protein